MDELKAPITPTAERSGPDVTLLFLGLFLLVLAFFVLLITISTVEDVKSRAVMDSLSSTFTTVVMPATDPTQFTGKDGEILAANQFQDKITNLFTTAVQVDRVEIVQPGKRMRVVVPTTTLFEDDSSALRPTTPALIERMVAVLSARPPGLRFDMEFVIGTPRSADRSLPLEQTMEMERAGMFARELTARGAPPDSVAVGMAPGKPERVTIWYYVRRADETRVRFEVTETGGGG